MKYSAANVVAVVLLSGTISLISCCQRGRVTRVRAPPKPRPPPPPAPPPLTIKNCPPSRTVFTSLGKLSARVPPNPPVYDSFNQLAVQTSGPNLNDLLPPGKHQITYRATDKYGREAICRQSITVEIARCSGLPGVPANGSISCDPKLQTLAGTQCFYSCDNYFQMAGDAQTRCLSDGTWSSLMPKCKKKCEDPIMQGQNGTIVCSGFPIRICLVVCHKGYELSENLSRGGGYIYCSADVGEWSHNAQDGCVKSSFLLESITSPMADPQHHIEQTIKILKLGT
ncbi:uncharacterized protein LOC106155925 isoform X2 [Lingula anatina]|nr:uncharacterized protein LOC106155925 isoform X2 [Lingula anatina]|eukprot:XP_013386422.1 uncharacterized protein LOC106155925 isoform X2 [Lingula anatina]